MQSFKTNGDTKTMRTHDRVFVLEPIDVRGKRALDPQGNIDPRLFTGTNKLHAVRGPHSALWSLKYDMGAVPGALKQQFTNFNTLLIFVTEYYKRRNVIVKEVIDVE